MSGVGVDKKRLREIERDIFICEYNKIMSKYYQNHKCLGVTNY